MINPPLAPPRRGMFVVDGCCWLWLGCGGVQPPRPADTPPMEGNFACGGVVVWFCGVDLWCGFFYGSTTKGTEFCTKGTELGCGVGVFLCHFFCFAKKSNQKKATGKQTLRSFPDALLPAMAVRVWWCMVFFFWCAVWRFFFWVCCVLRYTFPSLEGLGVGQPTPKVVPTKA